MEICARSVAFYLAVLGLCSHGLCSIVPIENDNSNKEVESKNSTLEQVHVLFRHGPRTPVNTYPKDPYINHLFQPYGWGHLINNGKLELYKIGQKLQKRYAHILGPYYKDELLRAQSTASPRTLMSMELVLAGMFPPKNTAMDWKKGYNWQPIPIYSEPLDSDIRLRMTADCPRYDEALQEVFELPEVKSEIEKNAKLLEELTEQTGLNVTSANDVSSIYITLLAEQAYGLELPEWTKKLALHRWHLFAAKDYVFNAYTKEMRKIKGGPFLESMFADMKAKTTGSLQPAERKVFMYCAHDWSLTHILSALNVWELQMPNFSAVALFELYKNLTTNTYYVEIYFQNDPKGKLQPLTVPGCDFQCPLERLIELSKDVLPDGSYTEMCRVKE